MRRATPKQIAPTSRATPKQIESFIARLPEYFKQHEDWFAPASLMSFQDRLRRRAMVLEQLEDGPVYNLARLESEAAKIGQDARSERVLRAILDEVISRGAPVPRPLVPFARDLVAGIAPRPRPGRRAGDHEVRDHHLCIVIRLLVEECGLPATRNREQRQHESACSRVATALKRAGIHKLKEVALEKIWNKEQHRRRDLLRAVSEKTR